MRILVVGSGGREHAICIALARSPKLTALYCAPGNAGIAEVAATLPIGVMDFDAIVTACKDKHIDLVVIGPEQPLIAGLVDRLEAEGITAFGPSAAASRLEGSKGWMKDLCRAHNIPTADYRRFDDAEAAKAHIALTPPPYVVKADGPAAGKGVVIAETPEEAMAAIDTIMGGKYGAAGREVVIEEFLRGEEISFFVITDGKTTIPLPTAQDHKRLGEGETGPNTGGMGAYSPAPHMTPVLVERVMQRIIRPVLKVLADQNTPYKGVLYAGLMITDTGPKLIEFNVRLGDPECQVILPRIDTDLIDILSAVTRRKLAKQTITWSQKAALTVVIAARGYPDNPARGGEIRGVDTILAPDIWVFHAGTRREGAKLIADGGRVLNVTALGRNVAEAQAKAYAAVSKIQWADAYYRRDIGWRAFGRDRATA